MGRSFFLIFSFPFYRGFFPFQLWELVGLVIIVAGLGVIFVFSIGPMVVKSPKFYSSVRKPLDHRAFKCRLLGPIS